MGCGCKSGASNRQVTSVKQVVKKTQVQKPKSNIRRNVTRSVVYRRPI